MPPMPAPSPPPASWCSGAPRAACWASTRCTSTPATCSLSRPTDSSSAESEKS